LIPAIPLVAQIENPQLPRLIFKDIQAMRDLVASWGDEGGSIQVLEHDGRQVVVLQRPMDRKHPFSYLSVYVKRSYGWSPGLQITIPGGWFLKVEQDGDLAHVKETDGVHEILQFSIASLN